jgi:hypothetical protein
MTLVVKNGEKLMPVVRKPNFSDVTDDVPIETFTVRVGNQGSDAKSETIPLRDYLANLSQYTDTDHKVDLILERDSVVLTSSQCCVLPVRRGEKTEFAVQLFNYQSYDEDPAVLVVLVSKDGVSSQIVERSNQKLFFNDKGTARWFDIERLQDKRERETGKPQQKVKSFTEMKDTEKQENVIMMIQIPLKQKPRVRTRGFGSMTLGGEECCMMDGGFGMPACMSMNAPVYRSMSIQKGAGMDMGQIGLGSSEGPFVGTKGLKLERDDRFPIRCTFQYYRVTDENFINEHDIKDIKEQLDRATKVAVATGSLVFSKPVVTNPLCGDWCGTKAPGQVNNEVKDDPMDVSEEEPPRKTEPILDQPKPSDDPFGKLEERDYLKQVKTTATNTWGTKSMASFM